MTVRMLLPFERKALLGHLLRLDARDRTMRFEAAMGDDAIARYVDGIDMRTDAVFGLFDERCVLRGAAHVAIANGTADLGLSVEASHRRHGAGGRLLSRAVGWSRFRAVRLSAQCLSSNAWMVRRMRSLGCTIQRDMETATGTMSLPAADLPLACMTLLEEQVGWLAYGARSVSRGMRADFASAA